MVDYWLLADFGLLALLLATAFVWVKGFISFLSSLSMMVSFYSLSPHMDINVRAAQQAELMASYIHVREKSSRAILFSTLVLAVIIFLRHVLEAAHAIL